MIVFKFRTNITIFENMDSTLVRLLVFYVTANNISVIYVTAHRCADGLKKKVDLPSGSKRL